MSGFPRDLAVLEPWELSLHRSRERRQRAGRRSSIAPKNPSILSLPALAAARNLRGAGSLTVLVESSVAPEPSEFVSAIGAA